MKKADDHTYTLTLMVRNQPGVLVRCAQVFGRRGHNIEALHVASAPGKNDHAIMTITAYGKHGFMEQICKQLEKLVDVESVTEKESL